MAVTKEAIVSEIQRTASDNGGMPLGQRTFERATGIASTSWRGKHWRNWGDAVRAAGFVANVRNEAHEQSFLIESLARLTKQNGRFPTHADMRLEREANKSFPAHQPLTRLGTSGERVELVRGFASKNFEYRDILDLLPPTQDGGDSSSSSEPSSTIDGFVYMALLEVGREKRYKIGKTNFVERRRDQISVQLPEDLELIHAIKTDDATGIEAYWHRRFEAKRTKGEWFALSREDVQAFKRRKSFM
jgi:hypothetical protein